MERKNEFAGAKATSADLDPSASVTVAMDLPYILAKSRSRTLVATYSTWPVALSALAKALAGKVPMRGYSPVAVSDLPRGKHQEPSGKQ
ncbi:hypothetical protein BLNAU_13084 [Blattamonas nauphoetae]|uniref:Uncharacterized protein n=1 Tax=Blattamonas nauphoetae TaxID=2049346 RepID=A0ABQ9XMF1_9EUKA|nr:hypothetical protein BLNAU_13084 [Blattamonas nauphoetae]